MITIMNPVVILLLILILIGGILYATENLDIITDLFEGDEDVEEEKPIRPAKKPKKIN